MSRRLVFTCDNCLKDDPETVYHVAIVSAITTKNEIDSNLWEDGSRSGSLHLCPDCYQIFLDRPWRVILERMPLVREIDSSAEVSVWPSLNIPGQVVN